jgi:hypothetical protein
MGAEITGADVVERLVDRRFHTAIDDTLKAWRAGADAEALADALDR